VEVLVAGAIFLVTYALIATDRLDKTVAALLGGSLVVVLGIVARKRPSRRSTSMSSSCSPG
jgi:Na+/H+ antiporter NhaD/arsenite permease-like protein